jgi:hypothetical protein
MSDLPANVDLQWIGGKLIEVQRDIARLNDGTRLLRRSLLAMTP